jgi:hypothetical protein
MMKKAAARRGMRDGFMGDLSGPRAVCSAFPQSGPIVRLYPGGGLTLKRDDVFVTWTGGCPAAPGGNAGR